MILLALFSIQVWYFYSAMFWAKVFSLLFVFFAEHSEDKQFPVHPAAGYSSRVCHHPQLTPTGPGLLRHDHLLQSCWWVWTRSPPSQTDNNLFGRDYLHNTLLVPALFSVAHSVVTEMRVSSQCAWLLFFFFFNRVLPEQCRDLFPTGLQLSWALAGLHVGMATASTGPSSS